MIFDSSKMIELRRKFQDLPIYEVPAVVFLDRYEGYAGERSLLEDLFAKVNPNKQKDWFGRFVNIKNQQHIAVWFEMMLYGWLLEHFDVIVDRKFLAIILISF